VPRFEPFRALRYASDSLDALIAPPYDVLSDADVDALAAKTPPNLVHVDVPRGGPERYRIAGETFEQWRAEGVLAQDEVDTFSIYRMAFTDEAGVGRQIVGVLGGLEVVDEGSGGVLPHERTTPKASTDRLDLTRATEANLSPVWVLSLARGLTEALEEPGELVGTVVDEGVEHRIERVSDPTRIAAIRRLLADDDVLIADGHHRYGVSRTYRDEVRASSQRKDTAAEQTLAFVNELIADQLSVAAIHRLYFDATFDELKSALESVFDADRMDQPTQRTLTDMKTDGFLVLTGREGSWRLTPKPGAFDGVRALDGLWLETALAQSPATVTYQHGLAETLDAVAAGSATAAVLIRPVSVAEIERTAREGLLMPPKSTFFTPKLKTGFVIRPLD
jgi:uncharacterized protein (DUF1015 family)